MKRETKLWPRRSKRSNDLAPSTGGFFIYDTGMGKHIHRLSNIDSELRIALCSNCGVISVKRRGNLTGSFGWRCTVSNRVNKGRPWVAYKKDTCERCGFVPEHRMQLDVDHIDGDRSNNSLENLQTLCANCHRLKTYQNRDSYSTEPLTINS
jgi:hypothetical protein